MSSILTNNGAMVALQTLKQTNRNMSDVQNQISTGKQINSAKDNAATWAISKVMEADVKGFKAISDSLSLGEATVSVARTATETVTDLLTEMKSKITSAQEENVDRVKIQTDIEALVDQVKTVVGSAQFNGLNLVDGTAASPVRVLGSLDRTAEGNVFAKAVEVDTQNLSVAAGTDLTAATIGTDFTANEFDSNLDGTGDVDGLAAGADFVVSIGTTFADGGGATGGTAALNPRDMTAAPGAAVFAAGDTLSLTLGNVKGSYTIKEGDTADIVLGGLKNAMTDAGLSSDVALSISGAGELTATNNTGAAIAGEFTQTRGSGGLSGLETLDVTTANGAAGALRDIEGMIQKSIDSAASFGSVEKRIEIQNDFVGKLMDSMKAGIGSLVDADMEETSARLQALQVQQQLGIQSLSMANQAPQSVLSLFR